MGKALKIPMESMAIDAAERLFAAKGYPQTTMDALAKESGISVGTLYNVFKSKDALYAAVALRIGQRVVKRIEALEKHGDPDEALLDAIRLRLFNYTRDRLFFQPFFLPEYIEVQPLPANLGPEVTRIHKRYSQLTEELFQRCRAKVGQDGPAPIRMAAYLEGIINAFMGYWSRSLQSDELSKVARQIRSVLLRGLVPVHEATGETKSRIVSRSIHISQYDIERIKDLLDVIRDFGNVDSQQSVAALQDALLLAQVTNPKEVPPDIVTMNSRVVIRALDNEDDIICCLVFPREAQAAPENVSILSPLGTALLGRRLGDVFTVQQAKGDLAYRAVQMLYQPEAAGDYHL